MNELFEDIKPLYSIDDMDYFELYGDLTYCFAVPLYTQDEVKKRLMAAIKSYKLQYTGIDYTYKKYAHKWKFNTNRNESYIKSYEMLKPLLRTLDGLGNDLNNLEESVNIGRFAIITGVTRLRNTFRAIQSQIAKGYHIEAISLIRLLLEQTAWYYEIYEDNEGELFNCQPHKSIKELKKFIPDVGRLYGELSKYSHVIPTTTLEFVELLKEDDNNGRRKHIVKLSNDKFRYESMRLYFYVIYIFYKVLGNIFKGYRLEFDFLQEQNIIKKYIKDIEMYLSKLST